MHKGLQRSSHDANDTIADGEVPWLHSRLARMRLARDAHCTIDGGELGFLVGTCVGEVDGLTEGDFGEQWTTTIDEGYVAFGMVNVLASSMG